MHGTQHPEKVNDRTDSMLRGHRMMRVKAQGKTDSQGRFPRGGGWIRKGEHLKEADMIV